MKKIITFSAFALLAITNVSLANTKPQLCIALTNFSSAAVAFETYYVEPYDPPVVQPGATVTLGIDWNNNCSNNKCGIMIESPGYGTVYATLPEVPLGSKIIYASPSQYYIDIHANVTCDII
jgi:hypothetical protein